MSNPASEPPRWTIGARDDYHAILNYIAANNPVAAERWGAAIEGKVELLRVSPYLGAIYPYYRRARFLTHGNYVIYYTVHRHEVVIRAVKHGAMQFRLEWLRRE
jgi:plasmid stabilization system protein ParE